MVHRGHDYRVRRMAARTGLVLASALVVVAIVPSASSVTGALGTSARAPALGHADYFTTMPSVIGQSVAVAVAELNAAKLMAVVRSPSATGVVYRQSPAAGTRVLRGTNVSVWAGAPAAPVTTTVRTATTTTAPAHGGGAPPRH
jgi:hypothetical protein